MNRPRRILPRSWSVAQLDKRTGQRLGPELPAEVPGDVFSDLLRAGRIADPYLDLNSEAVQWVNGFDWLYQGKVGELAHGFRTWVELLGLDYRYAVRWNGELLVEQEGMFSRVLREVKPAAGADNRLEVLFSGLPDHWTETRFPPLIVNTEPLRRKSLKTSMSFGWDFAPRLKGCGIWDEVSVFQTGPVMLDDLAVRTDNQGRVELEIFLDSSRELTASLWLEFSGETFRSKVWAEEVRVRLGGGLNRVRHGFRLEGPRLWWPWDQGVPELYRLEVVVQAGEESDAVEEVFGFREVKWARNPGSPRKALDWTLVINDHPVFLRGANLVPTDAMAGRRTAERDRNLLELAKAANLNALRLWGGGNRERRIVYETCDRLGLMLWQEFPIACLNFGTPRSPAYQKLLGRECAEIVRRLRNHPCLVTWCGGNEYNIRLSQPAIRVMSRVCEKLDPGRRFTPASPYRGDAHNWLVWHMKGNLSDYLNESAQIVSEFGLQAAPLPDSLRRFLRPELLRRPGRGWTHHHLGRKKMEKYVKHFGAPEQTIEHFTAAGQAAQAYYLHRGIESFRRRKYRVSGAFLWQWNDPWPCISWSVVDYYLQPKPAYTAVKLACQPLLLTAEFEPRAYAAGDAFSARVFAVNDLPREFNLEAELRIGNQRLAVLSGRVGPDEVKELGVAAFTLPHLHPLLQLVAKENKNQVSVNYYDLSLHDPHPASRIAKRLAKRWWQFLSD